MKAKRRLYIGMYNPRQQGSYRYKVGRWKHLQNRMANQIIQKIKREERQKGRR